MSLLGAKQGMMGPKASMMEQAAVQEGAAVEEGMAAAEEEAAVSPEAGAEEFQGIMQGIETLQAGVQDVLSKMIDMENQTVLDAEGVASFAGDMGQLLAKYQNTDSAAPAEGAPVEG
jgi:hypothetical protein